MWDYTDRDEGLHVAGAEPLWGESYYFDFAAPDGSFGGYVRLGLYPNRDRVWYWACLARPETPPLLIVDDNATLAWDNDGYAAQVHGAGYRATQTIRTSGSEVHLGLESDSLDLDLTWTTAEGTFPYAVTTRYEVPCLVEGQLRFEQRDVPFSGYGQRDHSWGVRDWWSMSWLWAAGRLGNGTAVHGVQANLGSPPSPLAAYIAVDGNPPEDCSDLRAFTEFDAGGLPIRCELSAGGLTYSVAPIAYGPVDLVSEQGANAHFLRAMCRFESSDGRIGAGWCEWHQPPGWTAHDWGCPLGE